jgi:hypothetical protein
MTRGKGDKVRGRRKSKMKSMGQGRKDNKAIIKQRA